MLQQMITSASSEAASHTCTFLQRLAVRKQHSALLLQPCLSSSQLPPPQRSQCLLLLQPLSSDVAGCGLLPCCCLLLQ
jgi:hypothetical protein